MVTGERASEASHANGARAKDDENVWMSPRANLQHRTLLLLRPVDVRRLAEEHFGRFHDRFGQRRVRVDGHAQVGRVRAHLHRQHALGDQLAGTGADDADAEHALGLRIEHQLGHAVGTVERQRAA